MIFSGFLITVLLEACNNTLWRFFCVYITRYQLICKLGYWHILRILFHGCWCPGASRHKVINSHGIQYVLVFGHCRLFEFRLYWRIRVLDSVKCPIFYQLQGSLGHQDAMSWVVLQVCWGNKMVLRSSTDIILGFIKPIYHLIRLSGILFT